MTFQATTDLVEHLDVVAKSGDVFDAKEVMTNFTLDVISVCGFGIDAKAFKEPNSTFRQRVTNRPL